MMLGSNKEYNTTSPASHIHLVEDAFSVGIIECNEHPKLGCAPDTLALVYTEMFYNFVWCP